MVEWAASLIEQISGQPADRVEMVLRRLLLAAAALFFILTATLIVAFDTVFGAQSSLATLTIGDPAPANIYAPETASFISDTLTNQRRQEARSAVSAVYAPPDVNVARAQSALAARILEYIDNVRHDVYASFDEKSADLRAIVALELSPAVIEQIITMDDDKWMSIDAEVRSLLEQVMQELIREVDLPSIIDRLPNQVSLRFNEQDVMVVVEIVRDLVRPNRTIDNAATDTARENAASGVPDQELSFQRGQIVVSAGTVIDTVTYESLTKLGLLQPFSLRLQNLLRAGVAVTVVMIMIALYLMRYHFKLLQLETRLIVLLALLFLIVLATARIGINGQMYLFASGVLGMLYASLVTPSIAMVSSFGLAMLVGIMANDSLEVAVNIAVTSMAGILTLRRPERLPSYFVSGLLMSVASVAVVVIFNIATPTESRAENIAINVMYAFLSGIIAAAASILGLYLIGQIFNFTTAVRLIELNQPSQALLQRLLREAPGTYQHSLQVANLSEQAANTIGANATLVYVAALYHDIGKMLNPAFFVENQPEIGSSPHDALNDPYASAAIIIDHVTGGEEMARKNRLPRRIRDFIQEHHGTTQVYVFYQRALAQKGGDESAIDPMAFRYPGPKPQTRETAILMLADSAEASVRSMRPESRDQIQGIVESIFENKRKDGQLDECDLTLKELETIKRVFVNMLKAMYHPRINYQEALSASRSRMHDSENSPTNPRIFDHAGDAHATGEHTAIPSPREMNAARTTGDSHIKTGRMEDPKKKSPLRKRND